MALELNEQITGSNRVRRRLQRVPGARTEHRIEHDRELAAGETFKESGNRVDIVNRGQHANLDAVDREILGEAGERFGQQGGGDGL